MRGWSGRVRLWATIVLALAALMICGVASAGDDATVERFNAEVVVTRDGALEFTETLTYYVSDDINGFTRDIDPSFGSGIEDFGVSSWTAARSLHTTPTRAMATAACLTACGYPTVLSGIMYICRAGMAAG